MEVFRHYQSVVDYCVTMIMKQNFKYESAVPIGQCRIADLKTERHAKFQLGLD